MSDTPHKPATSIVESVVLTPEQSDVWVCIRVRGMTQSETARALGISQPAVSQRVSAANRTLRRCGFPLLRRMRRPPHGRDVLAAPAVVEGLAARN